MPKLALSTLFIVLTLSSFSQSGARLFDGRKQAGCNQCIELIANKPKEVLFGVQVTQTGEVYFLTSNRQFLEKLIQSPTDGVAVDIVAKDRFFCEAPPVVENEIRRGHVLPIVYAPDLQRKMKDMGSGQIAVLVGNIPPELANNQLEGNLAIIKNGMVCFYTYFTDIERTLWQFLPMGLYADTLLHHMEKIDSADNVSVFYKEKRQFTVLFPKNKSQFSNADIKPMIDSLKLHANRIRRIDIRSYSSVEGPEDNNINLEMARAEAMVRALQKYQKEEIVTDINTGENWQEFYNDIKKTPHARLASLGRPDIKIELLDKKLAAELEPLLRNHRKAVVTVYLSHKTNYSDLAEKDLGTRFLEAVEKREVFKASLIQSEIFDRIADNRLPSQYINKLEIPREKDFMLLLNNQETFKFNIGLTSERDAVANYKTLRMLDPKNPKLTYNICALSLAVWAFDTSYLKPQELLDEINSMRGLGIDSRLISRMQINYHIRMCELYMSKYEYAKKDGSLEFIYKNYAGIVPDDEDLYSLAKYMCYYARCDLSLRLIEQRAAQIDVHEDLLFYYVSLMIVNRDTNSDAFQKAATNAVNINWERFCKIFNSINHGGSSFQLLSDVKLKKFYCENCSD